MRNCCDPDADVLEWRPDVRALIDDEKGELKPLLTEGDLASLIADGEALFMMQNGLGSVTAALLSMPDEPSWWSDELSKAEDAGRLTDHFTCIAAVAALRDQLNDEEAGE